MTNKSAGPAMMLLGIGIMLVTTTRAPHAQIPRAGAHEVTSKTSLDHEVGPASSPDGQLLAFEYHETGDTHFPRVGIMHLGSDSGTWYPLLKPKSLRHLFAGDYSWSPDSRWLALITDYPEGNKGVWADSKLQLLKVNVYTGKFVQVTHLSSDTLWGPTTAWLRSGVIVFTGDGGNIYAVSEAGGEPRKIIDVPKERCSGGTNTLAASPSQDQIAFMMDSTDQSQSAECNALWIGDIRTSSIRRIPTLGMSPSNPFWLTNDIILFSGADKNQYPLGIYAVCVSTGKVRPILDGPYLTPFVDKTRKMLYFSWRPPMSSKSPADVQSEFSGFHIWRLPLGDVLPHALLDECRGAVD